MGENPAINFHDVASVFCGGGAWLRKTCLGHVDAFPMRKEILKENGKSFWVSWRHQKPTLSDAFPKGPNICHNGWDPQLECFIKDKAVGLEAGGGENSQVKACFGDLCIFVAAMKANGQILRECHELAFETVGVDSSEELNLDGEILSPMVS
jgi:hypothetical protein